MYGSGVHLGGISLTVDEVGTTMMNGSAGKIIDSRDEEVAMTHTRRRSSWSCLGRTWTATGVKA
jgi:hypothetical protein